jgi:hypothetical protein
MRPILNPLPAALRRADQAAATRRAVALIMAAFPGTTTVLPAPSGTVTVTR